VARALIENEASNTRFETHHPRDGLDASAASKVGDSCFLIPKGAAGVGQPSDETTVVGGQQSVVS
jgi:hypothetical protein